MFLLCSSWVLRLESSDVHTITRRRCRPSCRPMYISTCTLSQLAFINSFTMEAFLFCCFGDYCDSSLAAQIQVATAAHCSTPSVSPGAKDLSSPRRLPCLGFRTGLSPKALR
jgi:hypothetical protein